jgi:hypothetical protein
LVYKTNTYVPQEQQEINTISAVPAVQPQVNTNMCVPGAQTPANPTKQESALFDLWRL